MANSGRDNASTQTPQVGDVAWLKIISVNDSGALLHWGQPNELLLPFNEVPQHLKPQLEPGNRVMVIVFEDEHEHVAASARLGEFISPDAECFQEGEKVSVMIDDRSDIGQRVIVNHLYWGVIHNNEIFQPLHRGDTHIGYIKTLRADGKLNVSLNAPGHAKIDSIAEGILKTLTSHGGFMLVSDKSSPELIYKLFGISKKVFKQSIGHLYKSHRILIEDKGIRIA
jgi:predicted RNA-binding protein (virulence factor B family)